MTLLLASAAITVFLVSAILIFALTGKQAVDTRLMEIAAPPTAPIRTTIVLDSRPVGLLGRVAGSLTGVLKPIRNLINANDEDLGYRLSLAGLRRPEHIEIYTAAKILLPILGVIAAAFSGDNMIAVGLVGIVAGFFGPDLVVSQLITRRKDSIKKALPDAMDLLVICMEAGLGIDQAMVRVGDEMRLTSPPLADELMIINREQRAGKPRLEAWRSMSERVDLEHVRQFVSMLVQTERFGTPIANALGQFSDSLRMKRMQAAEEMAAKTGVKLLFPLVLFIFPSVFVVTIGPAVLDVQRSLTEFFK